MNDMTEYEATFQNIPPNLHGVCLDNGYALVHERVLIIRMAFHLPKPDPNSWVRVRKEHQKITLSYKSISPESTIESQQEAEVEVSSWGQTIAILESIGCKEKAYQENFRTTYQKGSVVVTLDEWPFLDPFVEIEGASESEVKQAATELGFDWNEAIFDAVTALYANRYGISRKRINNETPRIVFDEPNPFL